MRASDGTEVRLVDDVSKEKWTRYPLERIPDFLYHAQPKKQES